MLVYEDTEAITDLPWYIISPTKTWFRVLNVEIQLMTLMTVILTPLTMVFTMMDGKLHDQVIWLVWLCDISWCV